MRKHLPRIARVVGLLLLIGASGCQTIMYGKASDLNHLSIGMTRDQVEKEMGEPLQVTVDGDKGEQCLTYKRMKSVISWAPCYYRITLRDGKVIKWDEEDNSRQPAQDTSSMKKKD